MVQDLLFSPKKSPMSKNFWDYLKILRPLISPKLKPQRRVTIHLHSRSHQEKR
jgi:hypothetical protein